VFVVATLAPRLLVGGATPETVSPAGKGTQMSRVDSINRILRDLQNASPAVEASALISEDGLMLASALPQHIDESRVAGVSATLSTLGQRAARELERGDVEEVLVRGKQGYAVMIAASAGTVLLALASRDAKLGLIFLDMRRAVEDLRKVV
jgi:predicted regulator of Ras-like GTPase activity (Roadblock/LC7/MglB family)